MDGEPDALEHLRSQVDSIIRQLNVVHSPKTMEIVRAVPKPDRRSVERPYRMTLDDFPEEKPNESSSPGPAACVDSTPSELRPGASGSRTRIGIWWRAAWSWTRATSALRIANTKAMSRFIKPDDNSYVSQSPGTLKS